MRKFWLIGIGLFLVAMAGLQVWYYAPLGRAQITVDGVSHSLPEWRSRAEAGEKLAQYVVGELYRKGEGVTADAALAFDWLRKSAEQGEPRAQLELGLMYRIGYGVERSDTDAVKWLKLAAEQGNGDAAYNLGYILDKGTQISTKDPQWAQLTAGVNLPKELQGSDERKVLVRNAAEAARWYRRAAEHRHIGAMVNLGNMYRDGRGVEKNGSEAIRLFQAAAEGVRTNKTDPMPSMAALNLAVAYEKGDIVAQDYGAAAQWAEATLASPALPPLMEVAAAHLLAGLYAEGHGVPRDEEKARALQARATTVWQHASQAPPPRP